MKKIPSQPHHFIPQPLDNRRLANLCGPLDENLRQISAALDVTIFRRGDRFIVTGTNAQRAVDVLERFYERADRVVAVDDIQLALVEQRAHAAADEEAGLPPAATAADAPRARRAGAAKKSEPEAADDNDKTIADTPTLKTRKHDLRGRTPHQAQYLNAILEHDITFGVGPAGTGKTYLAVACAVDALERDTVQRIVLTRPAVEAGERLGFLPGDLAQKVDPYLRPLYDALYDLLGFDRTQKLFEKQAIEIAPLAYMRGRTLNHAFIILDEAQNTTAEQMKMFLTRIGFGSKAVITGDVTQIDLHHGQRSGLIDALSVLEDVRGIAFSHFSSADVVRHPLVGRIVDAYDAAGNPAPRPDTARNTARAATNLLTKSARPAMPAKPELALSVQYPDASLKDTITRPMLRRWVQAALFAPAELTLRFVDAEEGRTLNRDYRGKDYATNVLTFAYTEDEESEVTQADIIFCTEVLVKEAAEQHKTVIEHTAHLVVHGVLHAQGYDHEDDEEATEMENIETELLAGLGFADPYAQR